ncbi:MAG TPA: hypothetical protein VFU65_18690 [Actinocrinis sp.]|nr:hypothetical protein [Actinocrinis sp.]
MRDDLLQAPLGSLKTDYPQAVAAVLSRILGRDESPAKRPAVQFNSSI